MEEQNVQDKVINMPTPEITETVDKTDIKSRAVDKLQSELANVKDNAFAQPVIDYLVGRCREDAGLSEDVMLSHKTWGRCMYYIYTMARKQAKGNRVAVRNDVVYEWAEDFYHKDDKAEALKEAAAKAQQNKAKQSKNAAKNKSTTKPVVKQKVDTVKPAVDKTPEQEKKPIEKKKKESGLDGQMSIFDLM